jgi:antibiotic biosynthesis monooxygenase (ABM) superfamily enzyme
MEARDRRHVLTGLAAALVGLAVIAALLRSTSEPAGLVAWLAEAAADLARWATGVGVVVALVPLSLWTAAVLASTAAVLSLVLIARAGSLALAK